MEICDIFHPENIFPRTLKSTKSNFSILITFIFIAYIIYYIWFLKCNKYYQKYTVSYKQDFLKDYKDTKLSITFGLKLHKDWADNIILELLNRYNGAINKNLIKVCDENLKEIKSNEINENNYTCIIDYPLKGSNLSNHIIKVHLKYRNNSNSKLLLNNDRIPLYIKFKEPVIDHDNQNNPFLFDDEIIEYTYFYSLNFDNSYRKYIKIIDYITESFINIYYNKAAYLEDYEDSSKSKINEDDTDDIIGSLRLCLSKKIDIFVRKYAFYSEFFGEIGGHISLAMTIISIIERLFIKKVDNLRIFKHFSESKSYLFNMSHQNIIEFKKRKKIENLKERYKAKLENENRNKCCKCFHIIIDKIKGCFDNDWLSSCSCFNWGNVYYITCFDKICFALCGRFLCCCREKKENIVLFDIDEYIEEKLNIDDFLENQMIKENKKIKLYSRINNYEKYKKRYENSYYNEENIIKKYLEYENNQRNYIYNDNYKIHEKESLKKEENFFKEFEKEKYKIRIEDIFSDKKEMEDFEKMKKNDKKNSDKNNDIYRADYLTEMIDYDNDINNNNDEI